MKIENAVSIVSQVNFRYELQNVSQLDCIYSPEFLIHNTPWKMRICKIMEDSQKFLGIFLCCDTNNKSDEWTQSAFASFKFLTNNGNFITDDHELEPYVFDKVETISGCYLIRWTDLIDPEKQYVNDDRIVLSITIQVADPNDVNKSYMMYEEIDNCCDGGRVGTFRIMINNIKNLIAIRTPQFKLRNLPWSLTIFKHSSNLGLRLYPKYTQNNIVYKVNAMVKLFSRSEKMQHLQNVQEQQIRRSDGLLIKQLITWNELMKSQNGFVIEDSIAIEIEIRTERPPMITLQGRKRPSTGTSTPPTRNNNSKLPRMECLICKHNMQIENVSFLPCGHVFCTRCINESVKNRKECPTCNKRISQKQVKPLHLLSK